MAELTTEQILDNLVGVALGLIEKFVDNGRRRKALEHARHHHDQSGFAGEDHRAEITVTAETFYTFLKGGAA